MSATGRRRDPGGMWTEAALVWVALGVIVVAVGAVYAAEHIGHRLAGDGVQVPGDPFTVFFGLLDGSLPWPGSAGWWVLGGLAVALALLAVVVGLVVGRCRRRASRVDGAAAFMGRGRDIQALTAKSAARNKGNTALTVDQRNHPRPKGGADDIGAFEL